MQQFSLNPANIKLIYSGLYTNEYIWKNSTNGNETPWD